MAEFVALSAKVSTEKATTEERTRWRELRAKLAGPPPLPSGLSSGAKRRAHARTSRKLRVAYAPVREMHVTFTDELGGGGLRITAQRHLDVGELLMLRLAI